MYENLNLDLDLKLLFMATGVYYESGLGHLGLNSNCESPKVIFLVTKLLLAFISTGLSYNLLILVNKALNDVAPPRTVFPTSYLISSIANLLIVLPSQTDKPSPL